MKLSEFLSKEVRTALHNHALDFEAGRYASQVKEIRRARRSLARSSRKDTNTTERLPKECRCRDGQRHGKANHYAKYFRAAGISLIDLSHPDREKGTGRLIVFEGVCPKCGCMMYKGETLCDYRLTGMKLLWAALETVMLAGSRYGLTMSMEKAWSEINRFIPVSRGKINPGRSCHGSEHES